MFGESSQERAVKRQVSSAYWWKETFDCSMMAQMGVVYVVNRRGPRTEPWGTPASRAEGAEECLPIFMNCFLLLRYEEIHDKAELVTPNSYRVFRKEMTSCFMVLIKVNFIIFQWI